MLQIITIITVVVEVVAVVVVVVIIISSTVVDTSEKAVWLHRLQIIHIHGGVSVISFSFYHTKEYLSGGTSRGPRACSQIKNLYQLQACR